MIVKSMKVSPLDTNCYLVVDESTNAAAMIDPGGKAKQLQELVAAEGVELKCILLTHGHFDHTGGVQKIRRSMPDIPVYLHPADGAMIGTHGDYPPIDPCLPYDEGDTVQVGNLTFKVLYTPGHTPGSLTLMLEKERAIFTGDMLYGGTLGRADQHGGDYPLMRKSLHRLADLEGDWKMFPGHEDETTLQEAREIIYSMPETMPETVVKSLLDPVEG